MGKHLIEITNYNNKTISIWAKGASPWILNQTQTKKIKQLGAIAYSNRRVILEADPICGPDRYVAYPK